MKPTLIVSILFSLLFLALNEFFFWGGWLSFIFSPMVGVSIALLIKRRRSAEIVPFVILGSVIYGLLGMLSVEFVHVLKTDSPFDWSPILQYSVINAVLSFIGGLIGIVIKGFWVLGHKV